MLEKEGGSIGIFEELSHPITVLDPPNGRSCANDTVNEGNNDNDIRQGKDRVEGGGGKDNIVQAVR